MNDNKNAMIQKFIYIQKVSPSAKIKNALKQILKGKQSLFLHLEQEKEMLKNMTTNNISLKNYVQYQKGKKQIQNSLPKNLTFKQQQNIKREDTDKIHLDNQTFFTINNMKELKNCSKNYQTVSFSENLSLVKQNIHLSNKRNKNIILKSPKKKQDLQRSDKIKCNLTNFSPWNLKAYEDYNFQKNTISDQEIEHLQDESSFNQEKTLKNIDIHLLNKNQPLKNQLRQNIFNNCERYFNDKSNKLILQNNIDQKVQIAYKNGKENVNIEKQSKYLHKSKRFNNIKNSDVKQKNSLTSAFMIEKPQKKLEKIRIKTSFQASYPKLTQPRLNFSNVLVINETYNDQIAKQIKFTQETLSSSINENKFHEMKKTQEFLKQIKFKKFSQSIELKSSSNNQNTMISEQYLNNMIQSNKNKQLSQPAHKISDSKKKLKIKQKKEKLDQFTKNEEIRSRKSLIQSGNDNNNYNEQSCCQSLFIEKKHSQNRKYNKNSLMNKKGKDTQIQSKNVVNDGKKVFGQNSIFSNKTTLQILYNIKSRGIVTDITQPSSMILKCYKKYSNKGYWNDKKLTQNK